MALLPSLFLFSCEIKQQEEGNPNQEMDTSSIISKEDYKEIKINADTIKDLLDTLSVISTSDYSEDIPYESDPETQFSIHYGKVLEKYAKNDKETIKAYSRAILDSLNLTDYKELREKGRIKNWIIPRLRLIVGNDDSQTQTAINEANINALEAIRKADTANQLANDALNECDSLKMEIRRINTNIKNLENILNEKFGIVGVGVVGLIVVVISVFISIFIANKFINEAIKESKDNKPTVYNYNNSNEIKTLTNRIHKLEELVKRLESQIKNLELSKPQIQKTPPPFEQPQKKVQESKMEKKQEPESFVCEYLGNREGVKLHECKNSPDGESLFKVIWTSPDKSIGEIDIIDFDKVKYEESVQEFVEVIEGCSFSTATTYQTISKGRVKKDGSCWILDSKIKIRNIK